MLLVFTVLLFLALVLFVQISFKLLRARRILKSELLKYISDAQIEELLKDKKQVL